MVHLTAPQAKALAAIQRAWPDEDLVLIGALALGHHISMGHRATDDLDLAIAVPIEAFPGPLPSLEGWRRHARMEHRFFSPDGQVVDLLPAGPTLIARGHVEWRSGTRMSLVGFDLAFAHGVREPAGGTTVLVPPAPVLALLKMRAWLDRPQERTKDLDDLAHLLVLYVGEDDDRRFEDDVFDLDLDFESVSPFLLGRDLAGFATAAHLVHVEEFLATSTPEMLAAHRPPGWLDADDAERALAGFRRGLKGRG